MLSGNVLDNSAEVFLDCLVFRKAIVCRRLLSTSSKESVFADLTSREFTTEAAPLVFMLFRAVIPLLYTVGNGAGFATSISESFDTKLDLVGEMALLLRLPDLLLPPVSLNQQHLIFFAEAQTLL